MTKPPSEPRLSESDVQAFADGMLDPQRAASVETYLKSRPDEAKRVAFYGRLNWQMQNTFHEPDNETAPQAPAPGRRMSRRSLRAVLIAAVVTLAVAATAIFAFDISDSALDNASMMALEQAVAAQETASGAVGYESSVGALASAQICPASDSIPLRAGQCLWGHSLRQRNLFTVIEVARPPCCSWRLACLRSRSLSGKPIA